MINNLKNMNSIVNYLKSVRAELRHVVWPTKNVVINHSLLVIAVSIVTAVFLFGLDTLFTRTLGAFIG
ncbi:Protein translocase subunit SecE [bioreactor metagenome]|uniref:Protein translocase subunit SecE n=1 Tax=bioreactor metagenome TaxID=1076179 RepID=A0A644UA45_9ZZZZ